MPNIEPNMCCESAHAYSYVRLTHRTNVRNGTGASSRQAQLRATRLHTAMGTAAVGAAVVLCKRKECARVPVRERE